MSLTIPFFSCYSFSLVYLYVSADFFASLWKDLSKIRHS